VGPEEARRFLEAEDFDLMAGNLGPDAGELSLRADLRARGLPD
jgi:hypothetical protein